MGIVGERGEGIQTGKKAQKRKSENLFLIDLTQLKQKNAHKNTEKFQIASLLWSRTIFPPACQVHAAAVDV